MNRAWLARTPLSHLIDREVLKKSEMNPERHAHEWFSIARTLTYFITKFVGEKVSANEDDGRITDCR